MKVDNTSLFFNAPLAPGEKGGTAAWGSAAGQSKIDEYKFDRSKSGIDDFLVGMNYKIKTDKENLDISAGSKSRELLLFSVFDKVYVNDKLLKGLSFILLLVKEHSENHDGRIIISYPPYASYKREKVIIKNDETLFKVGLALDCPNGCWFVSDISIINQDELHFSAIVVDYKPKVYKNSKERSTHWDSLTSNYSEIKNLFKHYLLQIHKLKTEKSANEYIYHLDKVKDWFIENKLCNKDFQIWNTNNDLRDISLKLDGALKEKWQIAARKNGEGDNGWMMAAWNRWTEFIEWTKSNAVDLKQEKFDIDLFKSSISHAGLTFSSELIQRFIASLGTKPFVICSGLSGSGKTKLAQAFVHWISESDKQYKIIPVGADWTNKEPLLGYPNGLEPKSYVTPDSGALQLILEASKVENINKPFFMILDEMNLSHVERYFADFLSIMESKEKLKLYSDGKRYSNYEIGIEPDEANLIPQEIVWPENLFIIGTVNIDETTYMFSPKVLDRANVIEFRINPKEMQVFLEQSENTNISKLHIDNKNENSGIGSKYGTDFIRMSKNKVVEEVEKIKLIKLNELNSFFKELQAVGAEFGYRTAAEIKLLIHLLNKNDDFISNYIKEQNDGKLVSDKRLRNHKIDIAIMQKLLPKLHGSRKKLVGPLETLAEFCIARKSDSKPEEQSKNKTLYQQFDSENGDPEKWEIIYPISFEKIGRMRKNVIENGFTSYAEA